MLYWLSTLTFRLIFTNSPFLSAALPLPLILAAIQLLVGVPYVWTLWLTGLRKAPAVSPSKVTFTPLRLREGWHRGRGGQRLRTCAFSPMSCCPVIGVLSRDFRNVRVC